MIRRGERVRVSVREVSNAPGEHLVDEDAKGPPVDSLAVALALDHFGRQVLRSTAERPRAVLHHLRRVRDLSSMRI